MVAASNQNISLGGYICKHLDENEDLEMHRQFTGVGSAYNLLCTKCKDHLDALDENLVAVPVARFEQIDRTWSDIHIGYPQILERQSNLEVIHDMIVLDKPLSAAVVDIQPSCQPHQWIALLGDASILRLNLEAKNYDTVFEIPPRIFMFSERVAIHLSKDDRFLAVVNDRGEDGILIDLVAARITMPLSRGPYHAERTSFPVAFFESDEKTLVVHGTDWNRLDISDPLTGELLTQRGPTRYSEDKTRPEHYLDYFHSLPVISPDNEWIAEDGWVWHPVGITRLWNLKRWLTENFWESEDGSSITSVANRFYHWEFYCTGLLTRR